MLKNAFVRDKHENSPMHHAYAANVPDVRQILRESRLIDPSYFIQNPKLRVRVKALTFIDKDTSKNLKKATEKGRNHELNSF